MMVQAASKQAAAASSHSGKCRPRRMMTTTMVELVLLLTLMIITSSPCSRAADANSDADALRRFQATADPGGAALNWTRDGNPCSIPQTAAWRGVTCQRGRVYKLSITGLNLTGPVTELAALDQLRVLWAGGNAFTGELPPDLAGSWRHLRQLFLDGNRLQGGVPESVGNLTSLWRLNLGHNALTGGVPASLGGIARLLTLDLSDNALTGGVPPELARLVNLTTLDLSGNRLTGPVPLDLARRFAAAGAFAANAGLCLDDTVAAAVGGLQDLLLPACPPSADNNSSSNNNTGGRRNRGSGRLSTGAIIGIVLADILVVALLTLVFLFFYWRRYSKQHGRDGSDGVSVGDHGKMLQQGGGKGGGVSKKKRGLGLGRTKGGKGDSAGMSSGTGDQSSSQYSLQLPESERSKLVFFHHHHQHDGDRDRDDGDDDGDDSAATPTFDLEDLLRASAEMLGKGSFGTSYKAVLEDGTVVAVKRLKDLSSSSSSSSSSPSMSRKEFEAHMEVVGRLRHPNLLPLLAYYYAKDEKLLVYPYQSNGSLYALLHGSRGPGRTPLDWPARLRIARGAAAGLAYLHHRAGPKLPHANIKSSNILLDLHYDACVADFGVAALAPPALVATRAAGYRPPEHGGGSGLGGDKRSSSSSSAAAALALTSSSAHNRLSHRADVYSFGVLLLELLTGKAPAQSHLQDDGIDLPRWVQSVVREEWTAEVFDIELMRYKNIEEEMVALLQVAMLCVSHAPHQRPKMSQVLAMIDDIRPAAAAAIASSADRSQSPAAQGSVSSSHSLSSPAPSDS